MSDNVTPIKAAPAVKPRKKSTVTIGLKFREDDSDGFSTHDVFSALCGVCSVMDQEVGMTAFSMEVNARLAIAANVLAGLLESRLE